MHFSHLRRANFKTFSNHGGQLKCIFSHFRQVNFKIFSSHGRQLKCIFSYLRQVNFKIFMTFIFPYAGLTIWVNAPLLAFFRIHRKQFYESWCTIVLFSIWKVWNFFPEWEHEPWCLSVFLEGFTLCYQYQIYRNRAYVLQHFSQGYWILVRDKSGISQGFLCWNLCGHPD